MRVIHTKGPKTPIIEGIEFRINEPKTVDDKLGKKLINKNGYYAKTYGFISYDLHLELEEAKAKLEAQITEEYEKRLTGEIKDGKPIKTSADEDKTKENEKGNLTEDYIKKIEKIVKKDELFEFAKEIGIDIQKLNVTKGNTIKEIKQAIIEKIK